MKEDPKYPPCPECGSTDYELDEDGTVGMCLLICGSVFEIKNGEAFLIEDEVIEGPIIVV